MFRIIQLFLLIVFLLSCNHKNTEVANYSTFWEKVFVISDSYYNISANVIDANNSSSIRELFDTICSKQTVSFETYFLHFNICQMPFKMVGGGCPNEIKDISYLEILHLSLDSTSLYYRSVVNETSYYEKVTNLKTVILNKLNSDVFVGFSDLLIKIKISTTVSIDAIYYILYKINYVYFQYIFHSEEMQGFTLTKENAKNFFKDNKLKIIIYPADNEFGEYCFHCGIQSLYRNSLVNRTEL